MAKLSQCITCRNGGEASGEGSFRDCDYYNPLSDVDCEHYLHPYNNSEGMFKHLFSFKGRIRRFEYCLTYLVSCLYQLPMNILEEDEISSDFAVVWLLLLIPVMWINLAQGVKRCHDRGNSGWYQLIPFYGFVMLLGDGEETVNRYGTSPKKSYES
jgi:uncharacterized membrane protein YhaH (DUF805 family)